MRRAGKELMQIETWVDDLVTVLPRRIPPPDSRGMLFEIIRVDEDNVPEPKQVYWVTSRKAGTIRGYHSHDVLYDYFCITRGAAMFIFWKQCDDMGEGHCIAQRVVLDSRKPTTIIVPPGVYHGWVALTDDTELISIATECYNREKPDEHRVSPWVLGPEVWQVEAK